MDAPGKHWVGGMILYRLSSQPDPVSNGPSDLGWTASAPAPASSLVEWGNVALLASLSLLQTVQEGH